MAAMEASILAKATPVIPKSPEKTDSKTPEPKPEPKSTVFSAEDWLKKFETVFHKGGIYKGKEPDEAS